MSYCIIKDAVISCFLFLQINIQRRLFNFKFGNHKVQMNWVHIGNLVQAHLLAADALTSEKGYVAVSKQHNHCVPVA